MDIAIVVFPDSLTLPSLGSLELFQLVNGVHGRLSGDPEPIFEPRLVAAVSSPVTTLSGVQLACQGTVADLGRPDLLLIPALEFDIHRGLERSRPLVE
ncbi:MAG: hypothetical protein GY773_11905, partial [Actinomycetia bacterium]|nr:hypothetical protein [Actinomycetes bacterium]